MELAAILPHTLLYGGVKRYLELGNIFVAKGHGFTIFTPDGKAPDWFRFSGRTVPLSGLADAKLDVLIMSEEVYLPQLLAANASLKVFYVISKNKALRGIARHPQIVFFANSTNTFERVSRITGITPFAAFGGVKLPAESRERARSGDGELTILTYGRLSARAKGSHLVARACERLYRRGVKVRLLLFDTPVNEAARRLVESFKCAVPFEYVLDHPVDRIHEIYGRADIFAVAERGAGWSNTCAEAMVNGLPVVATNSGTRDILHNGVTGFVVRRNVASITHGLLRLCRSAELRQTMGEAGRRTAKRFSWDPLAAKILQFSQDYLGLHAVLRNPGALAPPSRDPERAAARTVIEGWPYLPRIVAQAGASSVRRRQSADEALGCGIYVLYYHSIVDHAACEEWERAYPEVATRAERFREQMDYLCEVAAPVGLSDVPRLLADGRVDKPYFVVTFDDGYANLLKNAEPVLRSHGIRPTLFVNSSFAAGESVYYRVLLALMLTRRQEKALRESYRRDMGRAIPFGRHVGRQIKRTYRYRVTEQLIAHAWHMANGGPLPTNVHLDMGQIGQLAGAGWEIGNHTASHPTLSALTWEEQAQEIQGCDQELRRNGIDCMRWLSYPNGGPEHVNADTRCWLEEHPDWHGVFGNGGVNVVPSRTEWLRIGVGDPSIEEFRALLRDSARRTAALAAAVSAS
jgi:glycosyltransferase involved in cell wall biosynthesis/peptidoglycan/xylan/chitin deacetylase (PgdA/CDA1 family)